jgi:hypothetical protein
MGVVFRECIDLKTGSGCCRIKQAVAFAWQSEKNPGLGTAAAAAVNISRLSWNFVFSLWLETGES